MVSWFKELCHAVSKDDLSTIKSILARDEVRTHGNLERKEWVGRRKPPLHRAAFNGRNEIVRALAESGFDVDSLFVQGCNNNHRITALHCAVWGKRAGTVKLLLDLGADQMVKGQWGRRRTEGTPLKWARKIVGHAEIVRVLEEHPGAAKAAKLALTIVDSVTIIKQKSEVFVEINVIQKESDDEKKKKEKKEEESQVETLDEEMKMKLQIEEAIENSLKDDDHLREDRKEDCPICFLIPKQVFTCQDCDNWVCQDCRVQIVSCPTCRVDLTVKPLRKSRGMERLLGIL